MVTTVFGCMMILTRRHAQHRSTDARINNAEAAKSAACSWMCRCLKAQLSQPLQPMPFHTQYANADPARTQAAFQPSPIGVRHVHHGFWFSVSCFYVSIVSRHTSSDRSRQWHMPLLHPQSGSAMSISTSIVSRRTSSRRSSTPAPTAFLSSVISACTDTERGILRLQ